MHLANFIIYTQTQVTYDLVTAASKVLELPAADILELFGQFFFEFTEESGYNTILQVHAFLESGELTRVIQFSYGENSRSSMIP